VRLRSVAPCLNSIWLHQCECASHPTTRRRLAGPTAPSLQESAVPPPQIWTRPTPSLPDASTGFEPPRSNFPSSWARPATQMRHRATTLFRERVDAPVTPCRADFGSLLNPSGALGGRTLKRRERRAPAAHATFRLLQRANVRGCWNHSGARSGAKAVRPPIVLSRTIAVPASGGQLLFACHFNELVQPFGPWLIGKRRILEIGAGMLR
jgi:hypothetical protein